MKTDFGEWIQSMIDERGWSQSELARRAGTTSTTVSRIISKERLPGVEFCRGVAKALGMRDIEVLQRAGLADPEPPSDTPSVREMIAKFARLSDEDQAYMLKIVTALDESEQAQKRRRSRPLKAARS